MVSILKHPVKKPKIKQDLNDISSKANSLMSKVPKSDQFKFEKDKKLIEEVYTNLFRVRFNIIKLLNRI